MAKIKIFPLGPWYFCTTLWVKNSLKITLSLIISEIFSMFYVPLKSKMAAVSGENWNFSPLDRILLYHPVDQKFTVNRSISYCFRDSHTFFIFRLNPRWPPKVATIEIFTLGTWYSCTTLRVKNSLKITLSLTICAIFSMFYFPLKSKMVAKSGEN